MRVRLYVLARELNMESKDLVALCRQVGIDVKSQLSSIPGDQVGALAPGLKMTPSALYELCQTIDSDMDVPTKTAPVVKAPPVIAKPTVPPVSQESRKLIVPTVKPIVSRPAEVPAGTQAPSSAPHLERLCRLGKELNLADIDKLKKKDPDDAIKAIRKAAESVLRKILHQPRIGFLDAVSQIEEQVSGKCRAFLHYVRSVGNVATHSDESFSEQDVDHLAYALANVLEELSSRAMIRA
jgi:hypothetical protein